MSRLSWLQKQYWSNFGKPAEERSLFRELINRSISSILEIHVGDGSRLQRIAKLVDLPKTTDKLRYIGIDEFESANDARQHLSLKQAHQLAGKLGFKASLIPGEVPSAVPRVAHKMGASDLIIVDGGLDPSQPNTGFIAEWMDRLSHPETVVFACSEPGGELVRLDVAQTLPERRVAA